MIIDSIVRQYESDVEGRVVDVDGDDVFVEFDNGVAGWFNTMFLDGE